MSVIIQFIEHNLCHKTADTNYKHSYLGLSFVLKMYAIRFKGCSATF